MKFRFYISFLITFAIVNSFLSAQSNKTISLKTARVDKEMNFYEIQKNFNEYWATKEVKNGYYKENGIETKAPGWKLQKRWEWFWEQRIDLTTGEFPSTNSAIEYEKIKNSFSKTSALNENWVNLGTSSSTGGYAGIGRINCVAFHPSDNNTFWVGSPSGGIWKTTNGGTGWTIINNNETVLGVSDIAIPSDYATSNTLYIATGDRDGGSMWSLSGGQAADNVSIGVLKSTDGGATWNTTGLSFTNSTGSKIFRLLIHPSNNSILFASTTSGIYKTTDAGNSWAVKTVNQWIDMEFKPGDPSVMIASTIAGYGNAYINRSTDSGETWSFYQAVASAGRSEIAVSSASPTTAYLLVSNTSGGLKGVYKSTNSGASFSQVNTNTTQNMLGYYSNGSGGTTGQGGYDLCIAASPTNANTVFIGGVNTWKSTDGGVTWAINNMWTSYSGYNFVGAPEVHADKHVLAFQNGTTLFEGNDGGIYKTTNGGTSWTDLSNGLVISQLYRIGVSQSNSATVLTGLQDNGSKLFNSGFWSDVKGGDGMECIVDYSNSNYMYATYVRGQISRSTNGGLSFPTDISANITGGQPTGAWVTPYVISPTSSSTLFAGYDRVWKTTNRGTNWTTASQVLSSSTKLRSLAIAPSNSSYLYTAAQSNMWRTTNGGSTNWTTVTLPAGVTTSVTYIAVHATNPNKIWITFGGYTSGAKVYESTNGGASWTNISSGLPNIPIMSIVHYKSITDRDILFVGTDLGVYAKDGANPWAAYNTNLPNVVVTELEIFYNTGGGADKLRAGTYGRGLWETEILAPLPVELTTFEGNANFDKIILVWQTATELENYGFEIQRNSIDSKASIEDWENIGFVKGHGSSSSPKSYSFADIKILGVEKYFYRLKQIDNDGTSTFSKVIEVDAPIVNSFSLEQNFPNPFNPATRIKFAIPTESSVKLVVTNLLGQEVDVIVDEIISAGNHEAVWNASNVSSGIYFYTLSVTSKDNLQNYSNTKKMIYLE